MSIKNQIEQTTKEDDEISLIDLFAVLLKRKKLIILTTIIAAIGILIFSIISLVLEPEVSYLPNKFTVTANMLITNKESSDGFKLPSGASGLASMMGVNVGSVSSTTSSLVLYLASSNPLLDAVAQKFNLYEKFELEKSPIANARKILLKQFNTNYDEESGVLSISFEDINPAFAVEIVDFTVDWISEKLSDLGVDNNNIQKDNLEKNIDISWAEVLRLTKEISELQDKVAQGSIMWNRDFTIEQNKLQLELNAQREVYTQLKTQLELLKVKMQTETPSFQILEKPTIPDMKSAPSRGKLCIIVTFAAFFLSVFLAFLLNAIDNIKKDPEAMKKLSGKK